MKRMISCVENGIIWIGRILLGALIAVTVLVCAVILLFHALDFSWTVREYKYYKEPSHFVEVTAEVEAVYWSASQLFLSVTEAPEGFSDPNFIIESENFDTVLDNGLKERLREGQTITMIAAPRYFGDGYLVPLVGITVDGETFLAFEVGHEQLMNQYGLRK